MILLQWRHDYLQRHRSCFCTYIIDSCYTLFYKAFSYDVSFNYSPGVTQTTTTLTPTIAVVPTSLDFGYVPYPGTSTTKTYSLSGSNLLAGPIVVTAPAGFEVSTDGTNWFSTVNVTYTPPTLASTTIYAHFKPLALLLLIAGNITNTGGGAMTGKLSGKIDGKNLGKNEGKK